MLFPGCFADVTAVIAVVVVVAAFNIVFVIFVGAAAPFIAGLYTFLYLIFQFCECAFVNIFVATVAAAATVFYYITVLLAVIHSALSLSYRDM